MLGGCCVLRGRRRTRNEVGDVGEVRCEEMIRCEARDRALHEMGRRGWLERWTAGAGVDGRGSMVPLGVRRDHGDHGDGMSTRFHTPEQACTTYRWQGCVPACQLGVSDHAETYRRT